MKNIYTVCICKEEEREIEGAREAARQRGERGSLKRSIHSAKWFKHLLKAGHDQAVCLFTGDER